MRTAAIAIVGGGVVGASVAYHLAARGVRDILILERGAHPGEGSTGVATGGYRASFATPIDVRLSLLARESLRRFRDETGVDPEYVPIGYLWLAAHEKEMRALREALAVQHAEGLPETALVDPGEIARLNPWVRAAEGGDAGFVGGLFCPTDGVLRPMKILEGYLSAAARAGVTIEYGVQVTGVVREGDDAAQGETDRSGRIVRLETTQGPLEVGSVVNAAGAWAGSLAALAGIVLPVTPLRRQVAVTEPFAAIPESMPLTIYAADGFHFRLCDGRVLLLWPDSPLGRAERADPFDRRVDPDWVAAVAEEARRRVPVLASAAIDTAACRAGLYEMSPDRHAILGAAPDCPNFYLANGSSGHGVMHAPALGLLLAEIVTTGEARSLDVAPLRPSRFAEGGIEGSVELL